MRLLAFIMLTALCACARPAVQVAPLAVPDLPVAGLPPFPTDGELPEFDAARQTSAQKQVFSFNPGAFAQTAGNVSLGTVQTAIKPTVKGLAWAMTRLYFGGAQVEQIDFLTTSEGQFWILIADYHVNGWDLRGPFSGDAPAVDVTGDQYYSPKANMHVVVMAFDNRDVSVFGYGVTVDGGLSHIHELAILTNGRVQLINASERPVLIYTNEDFPGLRCAAAQLPEPASIADWTHSQVFGPNIVEHFSAAALGGRPAALLTNPLNDQLMLMVGSSPEPQTWQIYSVAPGVTAGPCSLAVHNDSILVAFCGPDAGAEPQQSHVTVAVSQPGNPGAPWNVHRVFSAELESAQPHAAFVQGLPAVACVTDDAGTLEYAFASTLQPVSENDWQHYAFLDPAEADHLELVSFASHPVIGFSPKDELTFDLLRGKEPQPANFEWRHNFVASLFTVPQRRLLNLHERYAWAHTDLHITTSTYRLHLWRHFTDSFEQSDIGMDSIVATSQQPLGVQSIAAIGGQPSLVFLEERPGGSQGLFYMRMDYSQ